MFIKQNVGVIHIEQSSNDDELIIIKPENAQRFFLF